MSGTTDDTLLGTLRRRQATAAIAAAAERCTQRPAAARLRPRKGAFNAAAAEQLNRWKDL